MEKIITINEKEIKLTNNSLWTFIYRDTFGVDLVESLMPVLAAGMQIAGGLLDELGDTRDVEIADVLRARNSDAINDAYIYLATMKLTEIMQMTWAMAKAADENIKPVYNWIRDVGDFPLDVIVPAVVELLMNEFVSLKNRERLQKKMPDLQPIK